MLNRQSEIFLIKILNADPSKLSHGGSKLRQNVLTYKTQTKSIY